MTELMRQIETLDGAVENWKKVEKDIEKFPQQIAKATEQELTDAIESYKSSREKVIEEEIAAYKGEVEKKAKEEMERLRKQIWDVYSEKKNAIITDLIHRLHGGI